MISVFYGVRKMSAEDGDGRVPNLKALSRRTGYHSYRHENPEEKKIRQVFACVLI